VNTTEYKGRQITYGIRIPSCWAKCGAIYEGGYRTERQAINAVKRRIDKLVEHSSVSATNVCDALNNS
jgi:hypothetical protein